MLPLEEGEAPGAAGVEVGGAEGGDVVGAEAGGELVGDVVPDGEVVVVVRARVFGREVRVEAREEAADGVGAEDVGGEISTATRSFRS